jgi:hypothetical protein
VSLAECPFWFALVDQEAGPAGGRAALSQRLLGRWGSRKPPPRRIWPLSVVFAGAAPVEAARAAGSAPVEEVDEDFMITPCKSGNRNSGLTVNIRAIRRHGG